MSSHIPPATHVGEHEPSPANHLRHRVSPPPKQCEELELNSPVHRLPACGCAAL